MPPSVALGRLRLSSGLNANLSASLPAHQPDSQSGGKNFQGIHLVRPLLPFTREEILAYCRTYDLDPRWDESNQDETFFRNRLRHGLIPQLKAINPNLTTVLTRTAFALQGDYQVLNAHRRELWRDLAQVEPGRVRLRLSAFRTLMRGDQRALLRRAMAVLRPRHRNISWEHTERVLDVLATHPERASGGPYTLTAGLEAWLSYDWLDVQEPDFIPGDVPQIGEPGHLTLPGELTLNPGWRLTARAVTWRPGEEAPWLRRSSPDIIWLPAETSGPLLLRPRRPGDHMRPLGLGGDKSIKDLMNERRIPRAARPRWPLLTDAAGGILWLVGQRASELAQASPDAARAWEITLSGPEKGYVSAPPEA
jgi:tRNA(Ile)-lysidine synthase